MKTPAFWSSRGLLSTLLQPVAELVDMAGILYRAFTPMVKLPVPVICVGNLTAGGAGKTPVALHIGHRLKEKQVPAFFLSRGYGGTVTGPVVVNPKKHSAADVGDEPLLLAQMLPTVIAKDRLSGARYAISKGAKAIIMDDGFQNPHIAKSLSFVVINGSTGFGNGLRIPAGPLRESPVLGLRRAHAVIVINRTTATPELPKDTLVFNARTVPTDALSLKGKKILPFCGIAYPKNFFDMLTSLGANIVETKSFPDHYPYSESDINALITAGGSKRALPITTAKDFVRIPPKLKEYVAVVDIQLELDNEPMLDAMLDYVLSQYEKS